MIWSYSAGAVVLAAWLVGTVLRGDWSRARGFDKLTVLGPLFYAVPLAAFGTEHFTFTDAVASLIPAWIPWHRFLAYLVGACFVAAALSLVTKIQARLAASLLAADVLPLRRADGSSPLGHRTRETGLLSRSRSGNSPSAAELWPWQPASSHKSASVARTSLRRLPDTSSQFPCWSLVSSNSCTAITFLASR